MQSCMLKTREGRKREEGNVDGVSVIDWNKYEM